MTRIHKGSSPPLRLTALSFARTWPTLDEVSLAYMELEQDSYFSLFSSADITTYIDRSLHYGKQAAQKIALPTSSGLDELLNVVLRSGAAVRFDDGTSSQSHWVRAQYKPKEKQIVIYRSSLEQLRQFFARAHFNVSPDDLIALHLYHEWFHHLEVTRLGRTDRSLPKIIVHKWGPFKQRAYVERTREIAAHAFTQHALGISWYPSLLDHLLHYEEKGWSNGRIREHFQQIRTQIEAHYALIVPKIEEEPS
ncbi:hypothetical protein [Mechercharimyces sp. CAU 1602]|uniref:hypothetical protein n=1 Tax=Mechercharimyces sp. CAU 1602 TaxID=2973933 RepID=UPI002161E806|nr:hypothetical protein [Mechercharimyces sp. CAU 1602]MCS1351518.1 hypothetical protein [Mechercharimyces sp. CAU 1602]